MKQQIYITDQEKEKCGNVIAAFSEFFQQTDILALDTGKYGFALLKYFNGDGFDYIETYINSEALFDVLWQEWLKDKLMTLCISTPLIDPEYEKMFDGLPVKQHVKTVFRLSTVSALSSRHSVKGSAYVPLIRGTSISCPYDP